MGGTDDPDNLVKVTIEQHAALHKQLWEDLGNKEDYIAWRMLSGLITISEAKKEAQMMGSSRGGKIGGPIAGTKCKREKIGYMKLTKDENIKFGKMTVEMKRGIHSPTWDKSIGGKMGCQKCKEEGIGFCAPGFDSGKGSRNRKAVYKGNKEMRVHKEELNLFLESGWKLGSKRGKRP